MRKYFAFLVVVIFLFANCATMERARKKNEMNQYLSGQIASLTYDQAISSWGPPLSTTEGDEIFVCIWGSEKSVYAVIPTQYATYGGNISHGWKLQITFNKLKKIMINGAYTNW